MKNISDPEIILGSDLTKESLALLFKRAFFKISVDSDGDIIVNTDGPRVFVTLDSNKNLLKYMSVYGFKESAPLELKYSLINKMNDQIILVRFSMPEKRPDMLMADYFISYEECIPTFQIISTLRLFATVVSGAIRTCDTDDLVE